jgi:hypothetical protein
MSLFRQTEFEKYFSFEDLGLLGYYWQIVTVVAKDGRDIFRVSQSKKCAGFMFILFNMSTKCAKNPWTKGILIF